MNILFTLPNRQKIWDESKSMTARLWRKKPPEAGDIIFAQTGYKNETRFATLRVLNVWEWDGEWDGNASDITGLCPQTIAVREGYTSWDEFYDVYKALNAHNWDDSQRTHYFIVFELHSRLWSDTPDIDELMERLAYEGKDQEVYALRLEIQEDDSPVEHIHVEYELIEQRDEKGEDCIYAIDTFTVWTQDKVYVSDPLMESVYAAPRHPPASQ